jgi:hypothetical protein
MASAAAVFVAAFQFVSSAEASPSYFSILSESCGPGGGVQMTVGWSGSDPSALQQRVDISLTNNGWQQGTYASGSAYAGAGSMAFTGLAAGSTYHARVLQLMPNGWWDSSATYVFSTRSACALVIAQPAITTRTTTTETQGTRTSTPNAAIEWLGSAATSSRRVKRGASVDIGASARGSVDAVALIDIEVYGPNGAKVFQQYYDNVSLTAGTYQSYINHWAVPADLALGTYTVKVGVFTPGWSTLLYWNNEAATVVIY